MQEWSLIKNCSFTVTYIKKSFLEVAFKQDMFIRIFYIKFGQYSIAEIAKIILPEFFKEMHDTSF